MMITESAGELSGVGRVTPAAVPRLTNTAPRERIPVVLLLTENEAVGARMRVGGIRVVDRAVKQLARLRDAKVLIASDGSVRPPRHLPDNIELREIDGDPEAAVQRLCSELGADAMVVGADRVWIVPARFDRATRVVDAASRQAAEHEVYLEAQRATVGLLDRLINQRLSSWLTRVLFARLPFPPVLVTLMAGFAGLYGALLVATGLPQNTLLGFAVLEGYIVLDGCAGELARVGMRQTALGAWLDTMVGDFVNIVMILAVGLALWRHGGTYLDMKIALVSAALTVFYVVVAYRELIRQREGDVMKLRWWFSYGQALRTVGGAGSGQIKAVLLLGRRDVIVLLGLVAAYLEQLPIVALLMMIVALVRAAGALGQLFAPDWRIRPSA